MTYKYLVIDTECLNDYWSFQYRNESMEKTTLVECTSDNSFYNFYEMILKEIKRPMYFYSIDYDSVMINILCKLVENKYTNINHHMRAINNYIMQGLNYFQLNKFHWVDSYFNKSQNMEEAENLTRKHYADHKPTLKFLDEYKDLLGKSKVFKNLMFCSIPKMMYYYTIKQDRSLVPSISLKNLQLIHEGYNVKVDFGKIESINDVDYETFIQYSKNDVDFLNRFFQKNILPKIEEKYYALMAVRSISNKYIDDNVIYAENNTPLINSILSIEKPNKDFELNYREYINTNNKKFNDFVDYINNNQDEKLDKTLKVNFSENYIDDDYNMNEELIVNSFDEITLNGTICKIGLGGIHGAIPNCIREDLIHLDYRSQYPSIILQFKELFKNIIDIELYEAIYNLKCYTLKQKLKDLKAEKLDLISKYTDIVNVNPEVKLRLDKIKNDIIFANKLMKGVKLILNSSYGLINSNFRLPISCKKLGRFICLYGQSLLINLVSKLSKGVELINVNTDGIIIKTDQEIKIEDDGYFVLGIDKYKKIIQKDVNNYILDYKTKGCYKVGIKNQINTSGVKQNLINAVNLLQGKDVEILPIYFNKKYYDDTDQRYYLTTKDHGEQKIKNLKKPEIVGLNNEPFYFTTNENDADLEIYKKYAEITKEQIFNFELEKKTPINFFEYVIKKDSDENIKIKRKIRRQLVKLLSKNIGLAGFRGCLKTSCLYYKDNKQTIIKPLIQYNMTQILESTETQSFTLDDLIIIDIDIYDKNTGKAKEGWRQINPLLDQLKLNSTFECWNQKTESYNRKFIFRGKLENIPKNKYYEIIKKGVIWSLDGFYQCNSIEPIELPEKIKKLLV